MTSCSLCKKNQRPDRLICSCAGTLPDPAPSARLPFTKHQVEATADPLTYVREISGTFFGQAQSTVTAFLKLFCSSNTAQHESRAAKTGRSAAYMQVCNELGA